MLTDFEDIEFSETPLFGSPRVASPFTAHLASLDFAEADFEQFLFDDLPVSSELALQTPEGFASASSTESVSGSGSSPFVACNNKMDLDAKWAHLTDISTVELNRYIRTHALSEADVASIKQARRRAKSRIYSKTARDKKTHRESDSLFSSAFHAANSAAHPIQVLRDLRLQLAAAQRQVSRLTQLVQAKGIPLPSED